MFKVSKIKFYWNRTRYNVSWNIAYRKLSNNINLIENTAFFKVVKNEHGTWGADPFLFDYKDDVYLFFEKYIEKKKKGVIACTKMENGCFCSSRTIIEEDFHMSFPYIFTVENNIYMIPETGEKKELILYKCDEFPYKWHKEKVLLRSPDLSDSIVVMHENCYVITSFLKGSSCRAKNTIYQLDTSKMDLGIVATNSEESESGIRNGGFFENDNGMFRVGQNCPGGEYGKSIYIWKISNIGDDIYEEEFVKEIRVDDFEQLGEYVGIHTYNTSKNFEVVDLKKKKENGFFQRIRMFIQVVYEYAGEKLKKKGK